MIIKYGLPAVSIALLAFAVYYVTNSKTAPAEVRLPVQPARAAFDVTVAAAGMVEPTSEDIAVGSPVPGLVMEVFVKEGSKVKAGDPLFRLDDRQLRAELTVRKAAVDAAVAALTELAQQPRKERVPVSKALVTEAEARLAEQEDLLQRTEWLFKKAAAAEQDVVTRRQSYSAAKAQLDRARAEYDLLLAGAWQYEKEVAEAAVAQARAQVEATEIELDRLVVRALVDGTVLQVNVRPGEFVGAPANETLLILGSIDQLHVRVDIDEHDIPRFTPGSQAKATLRGDSSQQFPLKFVRVEPYVIPKRSLTGASTERVDTRVLQVLYSLDPAGKPVYVGQQLEVFIDATKPATTSAENSVAERPIE